MVMHKRQVSDVQESYFVKTVNRQITALLGKHVETSSIVFGFPPARGERALFGLFVNRAAQTMQILHF